MRGEEIIDGELRGLGIGSMAPLSPAEIEVGQRISTAAGTKHGVVDSNGRVHGLSNLFIGSVFPTGDTAPPTLTVVALVLRLAAHLQQ